MGLNNSTPHHHLYLQQQPAPPPAPPPRSCSSYDDSWEEQAFAEDASGALGGCIWPPRSYSCTFCRREFRSAQALGGHMNVHRRDRARLKQSSISPTAPADSPLQQHVPPPSSSPPSAGYQFQLNPCRQIHAPCASNSPNPSPDPPPSSPPARVSADSSNSCSEKSFFPSAAEQEQINRKRRRIEETEEKEEDVARLKRRRRIEENTTSSSSWSGPPFMLRPGLNSMSRHREDQMVVDMMKSSTNPAPPGGSWCLREELDLELRLGDRPPKVKSI
ncbi:unnamed protein product [Linum tenue]|uniref:C2H2-type domain-containing protein n=1 Tax=Linum tenue TaxID=586396 RepID=A0AAV0PJ41_9ROSI|nr:unnamed protein product [Linum tenue]